MKKQKGTIDRKEEHLDICLNENVSFKVKTAGFEDIEFVNNSLPNIDLRNINTSTHVFGKELSIPLMIAGMTGGCKSSLRINRELARAAKKAKIGLGVGSQRAALEDPSLVKTYSITREVGGAEIFLVSNIGVAQLVLGFTMPQIQEIVDMIDADALAIHFNSLHEVINPEGEPFSKTAQSRLEEIVKSIKKPVIAKECGQGISKETAEVLCRIGIKGIDVGGAGGMNFAAVETHRAEMQGDATRVRLGNVLGEWGIPTAISIIEVARQVSENTIIIGSGGVRNGLDIAKCISLGCNLVGVAHPFLKLVVSGGQKAVLDRIRQLSEELRAVMFLTGCETLEDLRNTNIIIRGATAEWLRRRGIDPSEFAQRSSCLNEG